MSNQPPAELRLRVDAVRGGMATAGISSIDELATVIGVGRATAFRMMSGKQEPSGAFLAGLRSRLGLPFDLAVEVIDPIGRKALAAVKVAS